MRRLVTGLSRLLALRPAAVERRACRLDDLGTPAGAIYVIGDVHGRRDLLSALFDRIHEDAHSLARPAGIVLLGDLVDRGPDPAGVLDLVCAPGPGPTVTAVLGNHERLMLDFVDNPQANAGWLDLGGYETLRSYGLALTRADLAAMSPRRAGQTVAAHLPDTHLSWLRTLPHGLSLAINGQRYMLTHAGYDTTRPPDQQTEETLLWARGATEGTAGLRLVHGHRIVDRPDLDATVIRIDTGAWKTGTLTCLRLCDGLPHALLCVSADPKRGGERPADKG